MPYNLAESYKRLENCNTDLASLFPLSDSNIQSQLKAVKNYYDESCNDAKNKDDMERIIENYELFVSNLTKIKQYKESYKISQDRDKKESFQERVETINALKNINAAHKINIIFANLVKACELLFWISTSLTLFASIFAIALPVLIVQPAFGLVISITTAGFIFKAMQNLINCLSEFKSFRSHDNEYDREVQLISFFQPKQQKEVSPEEGSEITPETEHGFCF
ncbi:MAG: DUF5638 domain-containing protein [Legionella sp.]|nr:DUF5638 domain-containing protein [Legionella sp.]